LDQLYQREVNTLLFARSFREYPYDLWIDKPTRKYYANIKYYKSLYYPYNCEHRPKGRHYHREGYHCATRYAIKAHSLKVNQVFGHVQFGDLTFYESSYKDFLPIKDSLAKPPKKKLNVPFTISQVQSYYWIVKQEYSTQYSLVEGKQSLDYLDNNSLIPVWNNHMFYNEIGRLNIKNNLKFARFPPNILLFPDHPFDISDYPRLQFTFPNYRLNCINGFDYPHDNWNEYYEWNRTKVQKRDSVRYIYRTLMRQWVCFGHKGPYFTKYKFHQLPKTVEIQRKRIRQQEEERENRKAQATWLNNLPRCKKKKT
jgi:hypothetical protein